MCSNSGMISKMGEAVQFCPEAAPLSLYIHYPFCIRKCLYCDFLSGPCGQDVRRAYLDALLAEITWSGMEGADVDTIFFGGGTPSLMPVPALERIMETLQSHFRVRQNAEITLECNPGTVDAGKLQAFRALGVNRLSIGVQSFHDDELRLLGRIHTAAQAVRCTEAARAAGFPEVSLDLIGALPGQHYEGWMDNLQKAVALEVDHISAYDLILEEGTPLRAEYAAGRLPAVPEDEEDRKMYHDTRSFLDRFGYHRYEISNYAQKGHECLHNLGYWSGHAYLGLGLGASSLIGNVRFHNTDQMQTYLSVCQKRAPAIPVPGADRDTDHSRKMNGKERAEERNIQQNIRQLHEPEQAEQENAIPFVSPRIAGLVRDVEPLSMRDQMGEFMWLGLRKTAGVSEEAFRKRFGQDLMEVFGDIIQGHIRKGLLQRENGMIFLTEYGTDISNYVMCDFVDVN